MEEYDNLRELAYKELKGGLDKWIVEDEFEYIAMSHMGLCSRQYTRIPNYIESSINIILKKPPPIEKCFPWSYIKSFEIIYGIRGFINSLMDINLGDMSLWDMIYHATNPRILSDMLFKNIVWQLDDSFHFPCILGGVQLFKCSKCNKKTDYINENCLCWECDPDIEG